MVKRGGDGGNSDSSAGARWTAGGPAAGGGRLFRDDKSGRLRDVDRPGAPDGIAIATSRYGDQRKSGTPQEDD